MTSKFVTRLDPELAEIFPYLPEWDQPGLDALGLQKRALEIFAVAASDIDAAIADATVSKEDVQIDSAEHRLRVRLYRPLQNPEDTPLPALLWIHGGGFILGNIEGEDAICEKLCQSTGCLVASVEYRLAPQHPYPAAIDDCFAALSWLARSAEGLNVDPNRIAIGGCSAGGCLAAGVSLICRDRNGPALTAQLLLIPALDNRLETFSAKSVTEPKVWNHSLARKSWSAYLQDTGEEIPCYAVPALATDLSDLPPAFISVAELDLLRDEAIEYAQRLMQAGVKTELQVYPGTFHGSVMFAPNAAVTVRQMAELANALQRSLAL